MGARKWWALAGLTLGVLAVGLDATVLSVALPTLAVSLHASATDLQWFISAYTLALTVALLPGGLLGDRFGRKKVMIIALSVFGLGSLACAYAPNAGAFIAARTVLGLAAGAMIPLVLSVLAVMFTDQERTKAVSAWAAANFLALPIGPILGGWLLSNYWWGWVFLLNVPVVVIGLVAVVVLVPESRAATPPRPGPGGDRDLVRRPGRAGLWVHRGGAVRLVLADGDLRDGHRRGGAGGLRRVGASPHQAPGRAAARGSRAVPVGAGSPGEPSCRRSASSRCSVCCSRRPSSSRPCSA